MRDSREEVSCTYKIYQFSNGIVLEDRENFYKNHRLHLDFADDGTPALIAGLLLDIQKVLVTEHNSANK